MESKQLSSRPSVCIVIPVCNEEQSLPVLRARLCELERNLRAQFKVHLLFVDDGSTDATSRLLPSVVPAGTSYEVQVHPVNKGVGAAFRTGFHHANADIVCTIDADCSYGPEHLLRMLQEIESGRTDVIVASPYHPDGDVEGVQRWRLLLSAQCSGLYRMVSPIKLYTYTSIFRAYKGSFVRQAQFRSDDFVAAVELLLSAHFLGYRVTEMPLTLHRRSAGYSKMRIARTIQGHVKLLAECLFARNGGYPSFCSSQDGAIKEATLAPTASADSGWLAGLKTKYTRLHHAPSALTPAAAKADQKGAFPL